jgi:precorrin-4/cobalt-precorrin-4 C11-methyltransferase
MVIFLSITRMTKVVRELTSSGYTGDTPVAVVYRVGWPDELVIRGTLKDIADKVRAAKITLQALIIVGDAVDPGLDAAGAVSHLYSAEYTHLYRKSQSRTKPAGSRLTKAKEESGESKTTGAKAS